MRQRQKLQHMLPGQALRHVVVASSWTLVEVLTMRVLLLSGAQFSRFGIPRHAEITRKCLVAGL